MKKQHTNKLSLQRETLVSLSPSEMEAVNGAFWGQIVRATIRYCSLVTTVVSHPVVTCKGNQQ